MSKFQSQKSSTSESKTLNIGNVLCSQNTNVKVFWYKNYIVSFLGRNQVLDPHQNGMDPNSWFIRYLSMNISGKEWEPSHMGVYLFYASVEEQSFS